MRRGDAQPDDDFSSGEYLKSTRNRDVNDFALVEDGYVSSVKY